jgi:uncharacterized protein YjeT (DUF2065 family)
MATVDKIVVVVDGTTHTLTPAQWKQLPLTERVKRLSMPITFFAGAEKIAAKDAIAQLR